MGRGVVAIVPALGKVFVSWRLLPSDAPGVAFNVYRAVGSAPPRKLNARPLDGATLFVDEAP